MSLRNICFQELFRALTFKFFGKRRISSKNVMYGQNEYFPGLENDCSAGAHEEWVSERNPRGRLFAERKIQREVPLKELRIFTIASSWGVLCSNKGGTISRMRNTFSTNASSQTVKQIRLGYIGCSNVIASSNMNRYYEV